VAAVVALLLCVIAVVAALAIDSNRVHHPEVHTYNGTTWLGDTCFVDEDGVLWCQGGSV